MDTTDYSKMKPFKHLSPDQFKAIEAHLKGNDWKEVSKLLNIPLARIERWLYDDNFRKQLYLIQTVKLNEICSLFGSYLRTGFAVLEYQARHAERPETQIMAANALLANAYRFMHSPRFAVVTENIAPQQITVNYKEITSDN